MTFKVPFTHNTVSLPPKMLLEEETSLAGMKKEIFHVTEKKYKKLIRPLITVYL